MAELDTNYVPSSAGIPSNVPVSAPASNTSASNTPTKQSFSEMLMGKAKQAGNAIVSGAKKVGEYFTAPDDPNSQQVKNAAAAMGGHTTGGGTIDTNAEVLKNTDKGEKLVESEAKDAVNPELSMGEASEETKQARNEIEPTTEKEETSPAAEKSNIESEDEFNQAVKDADELGIDPDNEDPEVAKSQAQDLIAEMQKKGLINIQDGKITFAKLDTGNKPLIMKALTALSIAAAVATGGAIPPINVYKLSGAEADEDMQRTQYNNLMAQYGAALGKTMAQQDINRGIDKTEQESMGESTSTLAGDKARDKMSTESALTLLDAQTQSQLTTMAKQHANSKDMAKLLYEQNVNLEPNKLEAILNSEAVKKHMTDKQVREIMDNYAKIQQRLGGTTSGERTLQNIGTGVNTAATAVNTIANVAKP